MTREILIEKLCGETRLAIVEDGELCELYAERAGCEKLTGNIYAGRVENVLPGMNAAFVNIGLEKNAFLYAGDIRIDPRDAQELAGQLKGARIEEMVRPGQQILVQVIKEPGGTKGPRISCHATLPGRMVVLLPSVKYAGVSRRIEDDCERARLRQIASDLAERTGMGAIIRTAAMGTSSEEISQDFDALIRLWATLSNRGAHVAAPSLLHRDDSLIYRAVRDMMTPDVDSIQTDSEVVYQCLCSQTELLAPEMCGKISLYGGETPLFDVHRIDAQAERAVQRRVWLKHGGYLVFDYAEALTVIDVNTGKYVGKNSLEDTVFQTNCEAAEEIARQLRLRDLGGIIIIDFIDMCAEAQKQELICQFRGHLKRDRTRTNLVGLTSLGLIEMTRKKVRQSLHCLSTHICDACKGSGAVPSYETVARDILRDLRRRVSAGSDGALLVKTSPAVAGVLLMLGAPDGSRAYICPDDAVAHGSYEIMPAQESALPPKTRMLK